MEGGESVPLNSLTPVGTWGVPRKSRGNKVSHRVGRGTLSLSCSLESKVCGFTMIFYTSGHLWKHDGVLYAFYTGSIVPALWHPFKKAAEVKYRKQSILKWITMWYLLGSVCVYLCVCMSERGREREKKTERGGGRGRERGKEREVEGDSSNHHGVWQIQNLTR